MAHEYFADEIAIDFPAVGRVVERMRDRFLGESGDPDVLCADVELSQSEARLGHVVPVDVPVRGTCRVCGGRGEVWTEPCADCGATGESVSLHEVRVAVPRGVVDGSRMRFRVTSPSGSVRVEVRFLVPGR